MNAITEYINPKIDIANIIDPSLINNSLRAANATNNPINPKGNRFILNWSTVNITLLYH